MQMDRSNQWTLYNGMGLVFPLIGKQAAAGTVLGLVRKADKSGECPGLSEIQNEIYTDMQYELYMQALMSRHAKGGTLRELFRLFLLEYPGSQAAWFMYITARNEYVRQTSLVIQNAVESYLSVKQNKTADEAKQLLQILLSHAEQIYGDAEVELEKMSGSFEG